MTLGLGSWRCLMSDHKEAAESLISGPVYTLADGSDHVNPTERAMAMAQVHATLYLAEQQRLANLIAGFGLLSDARPTSMDVTPQTNADVLNSYQNAWDRQMSLRAVIKEGLGL